MISRRSSFLIRLFLSVALLGGWTSAWSQDRFLYVANEESNAVSAFTIHADGSLMPVPGAPFPAGSSPISLAVHPSGRFLYVWNEFVDEFGGIPSNVSVYTIQPTGRLTQIAGSPFFPGHSRVPSVAMHPSGRFMYVVDNGFNIVREYSIDTRTGVPTKVRDFPGGGYPVSVAVDSSGTFLYAANLRTGVAAFAINKRTGGLTPVPGSPFALGFFFLSVATAP